jgi:hypothetical protein
MRRLSISRKNLVMALVLGLILLAGILAINIVSSHQRQPTPTPSTDDTQSSSAVVSGVQAFFDVNALEGKEAWLGRFCAVSTESGCLLVKGSSDRLWQRYTDAKTVTTAQVTSLEKLRQTASEQLLRVSIQLSSPLPGSEKTKDEAYAVAILEKGAWKFDRFLMAAEIQALKTQQPTVKAK